jgi:hypothetical protein
LYIAYHIDNPLAADTHAKTHRNKTPNAPKWMRSGGLSANDWAVVKDYIEILQPLKSATKRLEGRVKGGCFEAIYKIIPVFEYLLSEFEQQYKLYKLVNYKATGTPEDHLAINLKAAWAKLNKFYQKLDESPVYYAACCLHPYYKQYCDRAWRHKLGWISKANESFQLLWRTYQAPQSPRSCPRERNSNAIDDTIATIMEDPYSDDDEGFDEYQQWQAFEPKWTKSIFESPNSNLIKYWIDLRPKYPSLARFAIDILTI